MLKETYLVIAIVLYLSVVIGVFVILLRRRD